MPRYAAADVLDDGLDSMKAAVDHANGRMCICEGQPASYAEAITLKGSGSKALAIKIQLILNCGM